MDMVKLTIASKPEGRVTLFILNIYCSMSANKGSLKNYINVIDYCNISFKYQTLLCVNCSVN